MNQFQCSAECEGGSQSRMVVCLNYDHKPVPEWCDELEEPAKEQQCNNHSCPSKYDKNRFAKDRKNRYIEIYATWEAQSDKRGKQKKSFRGITWKSFIKNFYFIKYRTCRNGSLLKSLLQSF